MLECVHRKEDIVEILPVRPVAQWCMACGAMRVVAMDGITWLPWRRPGKSGSGGVF